MTNGTWSVVSWVARTRASRIGRARRGSDDERAMLKVAAGDAVVFREEYGLLRSLQVPGFVQPLQFTADGAIPAMVLADLDAVVLDELLGGPPLDVGTALRLGRALAQALAALHAAGGSQETQPRRDRMPA